MTNQHDLRPDYEMEGRVSSWLSDTDLSSDEAERGLDRLLDEFPVTPQTRRRFLGRWFDRDEGARRRTATHDHPRDTHNRRNRLMFSVTGLTAALAVLALGVSVITTEPAPPGAGTGSTYTVAPSGGDFSTITEAVAAAEDGDTILIKPGTYTESVVIDKDITVMGDGEPGEVVVRIPDDGQEGVPGGGAFAFRLQDADVDLGHLTLQGDARGPGAVVVMSGDPMIHDLVGDFDEVQGTWFWNRLISVEGDATGTIRDTVSEADISVRDQASPLITDNIAFSIWMDGESSAHITANRIGWVIVQGAATPTIEGNVIDSDAFAAYPTPCGLQLEATEPGLTVVANVVRNQTIGICARTGSSGTLTANELFDNDTGMLLSNSAASLEGNTVRGGSTGISIDRGSPVLKGNTVEGAGQGLFVNVDASPTLLGNTICGNETNLVVAIGATPPDTTGNEICEDAPSE
ncbi:MAG: right-handed parallel beta-helix repeat-containing protein [Chloroflexota bacterium]|nr:right-handed parallel beta-helix repeat-containing protein [Chloroflexota bacterium]